MLTLQEIPLERRVIIERRIRLHSVHVIEHTCILWDGPREGSTYRPSIGYSFKNINYHVNIARYILEKKLNRAIIDGYKALHTCDNIHGACINEAHLYEGTPKQNSTDMVLRNREASGTKQGSAKLDEFKVYRIYSDLKAGMSATSLGHKYNVARETINDIKFRRNWKKILDNVDIALSGACS